MQINGEVVDPGSLESLEVSVFSVRIGMEPFSDASSLPTLGHPRFHLGITAGRPGGSSVF